MATKVYVVAFNTFLFNGFGYYSMYGHILKLAEEIKKGADSVEGVEATLWQVPETLPKEVLLKVNAPPKSDAPVIQPQQLVDVDALIFGFPTSTFDIGMFKMEQVKGGSPYGAETYAGDGTCQPSKLELEQAFHQGKHIANIAKKLKGSA